MPMVMANKLRQLVPIWWEFQPSFSRLVWECNSINELGVPTCTYRYRQRLQSSKFTTTRGLGMSLGSWESLRQLKLGKIKFDHLGVITNSILGKPHSTFDLYKMWRMEKSFWKLSWRSSGIRLVSWRYSSVSIRSGHPSTGQTNGESYSGPWIMRENS